MADVNRGNRPLSPHLTIYKPQLTSMTSILTRITGNALVVAGVMITFWFLALAAGEAAFERMDWLLTSYLGDLILFFSLLGVWYHLLAGIRHLIWDNAMMLELDKAEMLGKICLVGSVVLTLISVILI